MAIDLALTTPALLFPAISLLLLAYTNRFLVLAQLIRQLHGNNRERGRAVVLRQIENLRRRVWLMKSMQFVGVVAFILCSLSMGAIFLAQSALGSWFFGASLFCLVASLLLSLYEVSLSTGAIELELSDMER